jgi:CRP-like cAMP-binding protein
MEEQAFDPLRTRLIRALLVLVETYGIPQDRGTVIQLRLAQDHLGDLLGVSRQSINKLIKQLEGEQLIEMHYGRVIVRDLEALRGIAHAEGTGAIVD